MTTEVAKTVARLRDTFDSGHTRPAGWRKTQLRRLKQLLSEGEDEIATAMRDDLGKAPAEGWVTEVRLVQRELTHMIGHLDAWMRPHHVHVPVVLQPARAKIVAGPSARSTIRARPSVPSGSFVGSTDRTLLFMLTLPPLAWNFVASSIGTFS